MIFGQFTRPMLLAWFLFAAAVCDGDDGGDDFWDKLEEDDEEIVIEQKGEGSLYDKARFNLPVKRRLKLYPEVQKTAERLEGVSRIEFVYEARVPSLILLDADDAVTETIDISKMSQDEIISLLNVRGFSETMRDPPEEPAESANETEKKDL